MVRPERDNSAGEFILSRPSPDDMGEPRQTITVNTIATAGKNTRPGAEVMQLRPSESEQSPTFGLRR